MHHLKGENIMIDKEVLYMMRKYCSEKSDYGKSIKKHKMETIRMIRNNNEIYRENIDAYEQFITVIVKVLKEVSLPSCTISYAVSLSRMIHEGWLSNHLSFQKTRDTSKLLDILGYLGIDVINGYGCCRHISSLYHKVWTHLNLYMDDLYCYASPYFISAEEGVYKNANHAVNAFLYNGSYYIYDALKGTFYLISDGFRMHPYIREDIRERPKSLFYKPDCDIVYKNKTFHQLEMQIEKFSLDSTKPHISKKQLREILKETYYKFDKNRDVLMDLAPKTLSYSQKITQNIHRR